jgi:2-dehydro-3-deoxygluconokinase
LTYILDIKSDEICQFSAVALGEVMLRLDPGSTRVRTARSFEAWEGGGEYNVVRGLRKVFGYKTAIVTALAQNEIGLLIEDFILQGGVDPRFIKWDKYDGVGRKVRNGLNFKSFLEPIIYFSHYFFYKSLFTSEHKINDLVKSINERY